MIYKKDKLLKNEIQKLIDMQIQINNAIELINEYIDNNPLEIDSDIISLVKGKTNIKDERAFYFALLKIFDIDKNDSYLKKLEKNLSFDKIKELNTSSYLNNPYYKNIKTKQIKNNHWKLTNKIYSPYQGFIYLETIVDDNNYYSEFTPMGFFKEEFSFLSVDENNTTWMSITPHEIETMKDPINNAKGKVVVFGLGLGYFQYMISLKKDVTKIVIIEKDKNVIELFNEAILPQFENKNKITIINDEALNFVNNCMKKDDFDYAFIDTYHNALDGFEMYYNMLKYENKFSNTKFDYWIETSLLIAYRRCLISLIEEEINGSNDNDYKNSKNIFDSIINKSHFYLKNKHVNSYQDIKELLKDETLRNLLKNI